MSSQFSAVIRSFIQNVHQKTFFRDSWNIPHFIYFYVFKIVDCIHLVATINWKIIQEMGKQTTWPASWDTCMQVRKQQLELDMEQQAGSK